MNGNRLKSECKGSDSCILIFSVTGETDNTSRYRIRVFKGRNKLFSNNPIFDTVSPGEFKYYWFVSTGAIFATQNNPDWFHDIGVGIKTPGADVDMYVSVFDGRYPTEKDYDFKSTNLGAEALTLSSQDRVFKHTNPDSINPNAGLPVVIGVYNPGNVIAQFSVMERSENLLGNIYSLATNESKTTTLNRKNQRSADNPDVKVFRWYNWEQGNFQLQVKALQGKANFYLNFVGETNFEENAFTGIPINKNDSIWYSNLDSYD